MSLWFGYKQGHFVCQCLATSEHPQSATGSEENGKRLKEKTVTPVVQLGKVERHLKLL
jgi:hypothetical protein